MSFKHCHDFIPHNATAPVPTCKSAHFPPRKDSVSSPTQLQLRLFRFRTFSSSSEDTSSKTTESGSWKKFSERLACCKPGAACCFSSDQPFVPDLTPSQAHFLHTHIISHMHVSVCACVCVCVPPWTKGLTPPLFPFYTGRGAQQMQGTAPNKATLHLGSQV